MKHLILGTLLLGLVACTSHERSFEAVKKSGELRVVTTNSPITYYENREGQIEGLEYEMVKSFAKSKGLKVQFIIKHSIKEVFQELKLGNADIAAAGLTATKKREKEYLFTTPYQKIQQKVVCRKGVQPKSLKALEKYEILVGEDTSYAERLANLKEEHPNLKWTATGQMATSEIFKLIWQKKTDCTVADSQIVNIYLRYFPNLEVPMNLGAAGKLAWALPKHLDKLHQKASIWIDSARKQGMISSWQNKYYSHFQDFDRYDLKKFLERIESRLPKFQEDFKKFAKVPGIDWKLLAAISYQESHWDPDAKSPTGVRGLMMLTQNTAKSVGVKDRTNPQQSIEGGAKYLKRLISKVSKHIRSEDRIWVALASYNVGGSHVKDARGLAAWKGHNPNHWAGIKEVLPLLSKKSVHWRLPHGYARGMEPVIYVRRIRHYYDLLDREL